MRQISDREFRRRLREIRKENEAVEKWRILEAERDKGRPKRKLPSTSKLVLAGIMVICVEIIVFCEWLMVKTMDTSAMYALIGVVSGLAVSIFGYYSKAKAENTVGGITYEAAMHELERPVENSTETADDVVVADGYSVDAVAENCRE